MTSKDNKKEPKQWPELNINPSVHREGGTMYLDRNKVLEKSKSLNKFLNSILKNDFQPSSDNKLNG